MKRVIFLGIVLSAATSLIAGCGDDGDDSGDDDPSGGGGSGNPNCSPTGGGACQNDQDCPLVRSGVARSSSQTCALDCLDEADPEMCTLLCVPDQTGLTTECSECYAALVGCAVEACPMECDTAPATEECIQCSDEAGCVDEFDPCSGLTTPIP